MKRLIAITFTVLAITGCATNQHYTKEGISSEQANADLGYCEYESTKHGYVDSGPRWGASATMAAGFTDGIKQAMREREILMACMKSKGYYLTNK